MREFFEQKVGGPRHNIGQFIRAVLAIDNPEDARKFYDSCLAWQIWMRTQPEYEGSKHTPEEVVRANIGWCFGEGMAQERINMWYQVTGATHPAFGVAKMTPEAAFEYGKAQGGAMKNNEEEVA
jgi:hypothetical protein